MSDESTPNSGEETTGNGFTLSSYEPVEVTLPSPKAPDEAVDEQLVVIAERYATFEKIEDREVRPDDHLFIAIDSIRDDKPFPGLTTPGQVLKLGEGLMPESFETQVAAMSVGETKTFDFEGPSGGSDEDGNPLMESVTSTVTLIEIRQQVIPAITDVWVAENVPGAKTVPEFREMVRGQMESQHTQQLEQYKYFACGSAFAQRLVGSIPDDLFEQGLSNAYSNFEMMLRQQGMTREAFLAQQGMDEQTFGMQMIMQAREMVAQGIALDLLAKHLGLEVDDAEIDAVFGGKTPEQTASARAACEAAGKLDDARKAALQGKALKWLVDNAKITYQA